MPSAGAIDAKALRAAFDDGGELAVVDVREEGVFGQSHILRCNNIPLSALELAVRDLIPRPGTRIVLVDAGGGLSERAAQVLSAMGYSDLSILKGGIQGWADTGFELFSGMNVPSKVFGEYVEHHSGTPNISAEDLKAKIDAGEDLVILDSRPMDEYHRMNIPGGIDSPGAELAYHVRDLAPNPDTLVVVNCAGRTRSIIGAQSLINAGTPNKVMALTNGTMGWHLAGLELEHGATRKYDPVTDTALEWAQGAMAQVADKYGVKTTDVATVKRWQGETDERSLYLFDVRSPEEYAAGHVAGLPTEEGYSNLAADREDIFYKPYDREGTVVDAMNQYLDWEIELINQIERDGTLVYPEFAP
jgi:rhodanese-related sulfurtransferase